MNLTHETTNSFGHPISEADCTAYAQDVFTPEELEQRLEAKAAEVEAELARHEESLAEAQKVDLPPLTKPEFYRIPEPGDWDQLILVNCRVCRKKLLAPRCECVRKSAKWAKAARMLPPPVAGYMRQTFANGYELIEVRFALCEACKP